MKATDLQIGDWVHYPDGHRELDCDFLVTEITETYVKADFCCDEFLYEEIKPIPLTDEILEKNFEVRSVNYKYCTDTSEVKITEYTDGLWEVTVDELEFSGLPTRKMYVSNVHELQHVLKLCGIEKGIRL